MSTLNRRQLLAGLLGGLAQAAGTVVLARSVLAAELARDESTAKAFLRERADQLAAEHGPVSEEEAEELCAFVNGGFRKGGFVNGGFRNAGFRKGGFVNGGFSNAGFRNAGFRNF